MPKLYKLGAAAIAIATIGAVTLSFLTKSDFEGYTPPSARKGALAELAARVLADIVYFEGGRFKMNNVPVPVLQDGIVTNALIYGPIVDENRPDTEVAGFYMSKYETTNHDFDLYAAATNALLRVDQYPPLRQGPYPANISFEQAEGYCAWLAELTGEPFAVPTSAQWEYAARSGGQAVAYATKDGAYDYLETLYEATLAGQPPAPHLPDAFAPNPSGLYAMSSNLSEWVKDAWFDNEEGAYLDREQPQAQRVWRGANYMQQAELNSIYMRGASVRIQKASSTWDTALFPEGFSEVFVGNAVGLRCAINLAQPPKQSGFGEDAGPRPEGFPTPIVPRPRL